MIRNDWTSDKDIVDLGEGNPAGYLRVERGAVAGRAAMLGPGSHYQTWMVLSY